MPDLFDSDDPLKIRLEDAELTLYPQFLSNKIADQYFHCLYKLISWKQEQITLYGKQHTIPRLSAWYADEGKSYEYAGLRVSGLPWIEPLQKLRQLVESQLEKKFNSVLANLYRDGADSVGWHSDDEPELGSNPVIASLSLGEVRPFQLKHKTNNRLKDSLLLPHGSLLVMKGETQHKWMHQIPKTRRNINARINLTFRYVS